MRQSPPRAAAGPCLACSDSTAGCPSHQPTQSTQPPCRTPLLLLSASLQPFAADAKLHPHLTPPASPPPGCALCQLTCRDPKPSGTPWGRRRGAGLGPVSSSLSTALSLWSSTWLWNLAALPPGTSHSTSHNGPSSITHTPGAPRACCCGQPQRCWNRTGSDPHSFLPFSKIIFFPLNTVSCFSS